MDAGYFRGTSSDQDNRFSDKEKKLINTMKFEPQLEKKIDMSRVNLDVIKPWITHRITEMLDMEDDVIVEYIFSQLEEKDLNPKLLQINVTGFLNARRARIFVGELWNLFIEANEAEDGIPKSLVDKKLEEMKLNDSLNANKNSEDDNDWVNRYKTLSKGRYTGPAKEKEIRDDRIPVRALSPRKTPPRRQKSSPKRSPSPPIKRYQNPRNDRDRDRGFRGERRRDDRDIKDREEETKRREIERIKRHEEREKEEKKQRETRKSRSRSRSPIIRRRSRSPLKRRASPSRRRSRSPRSPRRRNRASPRRVSPARRRERSPPRRRFTENSEPRRARKSSESGSETDDLPPKKKQESGSEDSEEETKRKKKSKKHKKEKKHKKDKKKKHRKRSPSNSSGSNSESD